MIDHCLVDRRHFECLLDIVPTMSRFLTSVTLFAMLHCQAPDLADEWPQCRLHAMGEGRNAGEVPGGQIC